MLRGVLAGIGAGALWALVFIVPRMLPGYSSVDIAAGRFVAYGVVALVVLAFVGRDRRLPNGRQALAVLGMSVLGFTGYYLLLVLAIRDAGTEVPSLVIGTIPIWVMLLGKPTHLRWRALAPGFVLTAAGLVLMVLSTEGMGSNPAQPHYWRGILLVCGSLASWTAFAILNVRWLRRYPEIDATEWANWLGVASAAGALLVWSLAGSDWHWLSARDDRWNFLILCAATGFGSAWLATILWNIASRRLPASLCGQLIVSETIFALAYSFAWDGRWPHVAQAAAAVLFTLGVLASIKAHR